MAGLFETRLPPPPVGPTVSGYLNRLAMASMLRSHEKANVRKSIFAMRRRLHLHFGKDISEQMIFGSYTRKTILSRRFDENSDIDYMVVFADGGMAPQTYLDRLRRFVQANYAASEIHQSHPTIQLELNHIRFELVPAIRNFWGTLQIPAKSADFADWQGTDPNGFNAELTEKNKALKSRVKPLIRVVKCWNASAGYPFESFELEQKVVAHGFWVFRTRPSDMFYSFVADLDVGWFAPKWKEDAVERLKLCVEQARALDRKGDSRGAIQTLQKLLPTVGKP